MTRDLLPEAFLGLAGSGPAVEWPVATYRISGAPMLIPTADDVWLALTLPIARPRPAIVSPSRDGA